MGFFRPPNVKEMKAKRDVKGLTKALKHKGEYFRQQAAIALGNIGDTRAVEPLLETLRDKSKYVQKGAAEALDKLRWKPSDDSEMVVFLLAKQEWDTLAKLGQPAVEPLIEALKEEDSWVRPKAAAEALGNIRDAKAVETLIEALNDKNKNVRKGATRALGKIGQPAVEPLIEVLNDKNKDVREGATRALGNIGDTKAVEPLIKALEEGDSFVRQQAAEALGKIKDARTVEPLIEALKDKDMGVRGQTAEALGKIRDAKAVESLIEALRDGGYYVRQQAAKVLGNIGDARAVESLIETLKDKNEFVREEATRALGNIGYARTIEPLLRVLFANNGDIGKEALLKIVPNSIVTEEITKNVVDASGHYKSFQAVEKLCSIKSPVTSNLLILISKKRNISVTTSDGCGIHTEEVVDFGKQRQMAIDELTRRGSPSYDPSAFLKSSEKKGVTRLVKRVEE